MDAAFTASLSNLTDSLYSMRMKSMDAALASLSGRQAMKVRIQEGILHAMFGRLQEAEAAFRKAISDDPRWSLRMSTLPMSSFLEMTMRGRSRW